MRTSGWSGEAQLGLVVMQAAVQPGLSVGSNNAPKVWMAACCAGLQLHACSRQACP